MTAAEELLRKLGITDPTEIDLEAIAWTVGAQIRYRPLDGCEARIVGCADRAIITINSRSTSRRRRFSIGHELGHWEHHRNRILVCRSDDIGNSHSATSAAERIADRYAADLLMPGYLFDPVARAKKRFDFQTIRAIADQFDTSLPATAIRLIERRHCIGILLCHGPGGRKWFTRSPLIPERWFPQEQLDPQSFAFDVLFGHEDDDRLPRKIGADAWFDRREADRFEISEQTLRTSEDEILTLLLADDEGMLDETEAGTGRYPRR
jgi:hypothetical protein